MEFSNEIPYAGIPLNNIPPDTHSREDKYDATSDITLPRRSGRERTSSSEASRSPVASGIAPWQTFPRQIKNFFRAGFAELTSPQSGRIVYHLWVLGWPSMFIAALVSILPVITAKRLYQVTNACQPDNGFLVGYDSFDIWSGSGFFHITLGFGQMSFTAAKVATISWDIIVGRGGQALMVWISYVVYTKALVRLMESSPVTYGTFEATTLQSGTLFFVLKLSRDLFRNRSSRGRYTMVWMIISGIFVLCFQTIISAMAGYTANIEAYVQVPSGAMVRYSTFSTVRYIIHDAHRINRTLGNDFQVKTGVPLGHDNIQLGDGNGDSCEQSYFPYMTSPSSSDTARSLDWSPTLDDPTGMCLFYWHVSEYASKYGFFGLNQTSSLFNNSGEMVNLPSPSLNISAIFWEETWLADAEDNEWWYYPYGYHWRTPSGDQPFRNTTGGPLFSNGQYDFDLQELNANGRCQQLETSYRWGFSFLILFIVTVTLTVWSLGMYMLFLDAYLHSRLDRAGRRMGIHRAVLDLAACMQRDMNDEEFRQTASNRELHNRIRHELRGGSITYAMLDEKLLPVSRRVVILRWWLKRRRDCPGMGPWLRHVRHEGILWQWMAAHRYTLPLFVCSLGFLAATLAGTHLPVFAAVFLVLGCGAALLLDSCPNGKWIIFLSSAALAGAMTPVGPHVYLDKSHYAVIWGSQDAFQTLLWWTNP